MIDGKLHTAGDWINGAESFDVLDKFTGDVIGTAQIADENLTNRAVQAASSTFDSGEIDLPERYNLPMRARDIPVRRKDGVLDVIVAETGLTRADNAADFARCEQTLLTSAEKRSALRREIRSLIDAGKFLVSWAQEMERNAYAVCSLLSLEKETLRVALDQLRQTIEGAQSAPPDLAGGPCRTARTDDRNLQSVQSSFAFVRLAC